MIWNSARICKMGGCRHQNARGPATVLAIGKSVPPTMYPQSDYPDFYFNITNSNHKTQLKSKFAEMCRNSGIIQRYFHCTKEILQANPSMCTNTEASFDDRQKIAINEVPRLAAQAAERALLNWGRSRDQITHVVFATTSGIHMPGSDVTLTRLLGLNLTVKRTILYQQGCLGGATVLRVAKDLAENNRGARVLAVVSDISCFTFRAPLEEDPVGLIGAAFLADGASAVLIGCDLLKVETPLYEIRWSGQTIIPESDGLMEGHLTQYGLQFQMQKGIAKLVLKAIELPIFKVARSQMTGSPGWNEMFWIIHGVGPPVFAELETMLNLKREKLKATREVLNNYGNMVGSSILFILDQVRIRSAHENSTTTGEGAEWGMLIAFGSGMTMELIVLKSVDW